MLHVDDKDKQIGWDMGKIDLLQTVYILHYYLLKYEIQDGSLLICEFFSWEV